MVSQKKLRFPYVPIKFRGKFPKGHVNDVKGWNLPHPELKKAASEGLMLTMDVDMPGDIVCSLGCPHCYNPVTRLLQRSGDLIRDDEILETLRQAKALGLKSVKIIGAGEPLENRGLFPFLDFLKENDIQPMVFTKATSLGDDRRAKIHGLSPEMLARRLHEDYDVSILFGVDSFDYRTQARIVRRSWYPPVRDRAFEILAESGFNDFIPGEPTRLAMIFNPITRDNVDEIFEAYRWARQRHIYVISSPSMVAGECRGCEAYRRITPPEEELLDVYVKINLWAIGQGIYAMDSLERDGISAYVGGCPCQQIGTGLFLRKDGVLLRCPGDDVSIQGHARERPLSEIWQESENYRVYRGRTNVGCPPKEGKTFPNNFFSKVLDEVRKALG